MPPPAPDPIGLILFFSPLFCFSFFSPFFPLCSPSFAAVSPATGAPGSGVGRGLVLPPPSLGGDPWLCHGGPSPRQRWADRAIQQLVTPPVTNRPRLTRTDGSASQADTGGKSGTGSGPQGGGGLGEVPAVASGDNGEVGLRWPSRGSPLPGPAFGVWAGANLISLTAASSQSLA